LTRQNRSGNGVLQTSPLLPSATYFARIRVRGKLIRQSLKPVRVSLAPALARLMP